MTKEEHKVLKLSARIAALTTISSWQSVVIEAFLSEMAPDERTRMTEAMRLLLQSVKESDTHIAFPELPAELSDLWAAELQEALASEYKRMESIFDLRAKLG
jgi:hypothetical protein